MKRCFSKWIGVIAILCMGICGITMPSIANADLVVLSTYQSASHDIAYYFVSGRVEYEHIFYESTTPTKLVASSGRSYISVQPNSFEASVSAMTWYSDSDPVDDTYPMITDYYGSSGGLSMTFTVDNLSLWDFAFSAVAPNAGLVGISLLDITSGLNLFELPSDFVTDVDDTFHLRLYLALRPNHFYRVNMSATGDGNPNFMFYMGDLYASQVPEPTTMLLLGLGLVGLAGVRKKIK